MNWSNVIAKSFKDIFSPQVLGFILSVGIGSFIFWGVVLYFAWTPFEHFIASYIASIPIIGEWSWFQESGAFITALIVGYVFVIITISILTSLFSEKIIIKLAKKEYPDIKFISSGKIHRSIYYTIKANIIFLILFLFTFPLIFVPIFGQLWILWLWSIQIKEPTLYDVGSLFIEDKKELKRVSKKMRLIALISALFNYIPILNIFAPLFAQILFMHSLLGGGLIKRG